MNILLNIFSDNGAFSIPRGGTQHSRLLQTAGSREKGAKHIADEFIAEAERLSLEKPGIEMQKSKITMDINYRESVVADKQVIDDDLLRFKEVVASLSLGEQRSRFNS